MGISDSSNKISNSYVLLGFDISNKNNQISSKSGLDTKTGQYYRNAGLMFDHSLY